MPTIKTTGVVLDTVRVGEADRIVTYYSPDQGKLKAKAKGIARTKSKYGTAAELFALDSFILYAKREDQEIYTLTECMVIDSREEIRSNLAKLAVATYLAEMTVAFTAPQDPQPELWDILEESAKFLKTSSDPSLLPWIYQLKLLDILGHFPDLTGCQSCGKPYLKGAAYFQGALGGILCRDCHGHEAGEVFLHGATIQWIQSLPGSPLEELCASMHESPPTAGTIIEARQLLIRHCEHQMEWQSKTLEFMTGSLKGKS